jgi:eukaryotic-like serine/threonine-protein kinase
MTQKLPIPISDGRPGGGKAKADQSPPGLVYRFGPFELDLDRYELRRQGSRLRVAPAPLDLLILLIKRRGVLVNRDEIAARLWASPDMVDVDQGINTAMRRIREVLRDDPSAPRFIETVVGKGYRFVAEVTEVIPDVTLAAVPAAKPLPNQAESAAGSSDSAEPAIASKLQDSPAPEIETKHRGGRIAFLAAIALVIILGTGYAVWRHQKLKALSSVALEQITTNDSEQRVTAAAISPDGKWVAFADINGLSLRLLQSGKTIPLKAPEGFRAERIAWFSDQTKVLVSGFDPNFASSQIWTVSITGSAPRLFRKDARNGAASPDGARIAFTANKDREIWITGADGDNPHALLVDPSGNSFSSLFWSGDGKRVSYLRSLNGLGRDNKTAYESADANSGKVLALQNDVTFESACALADGRVFFLRIAPTVFHDDYSLWEVDTSTASGAFVSPPRLTAHIEDGRAIALTSSDDGSRMTLVLKRGQPHVYVGVLQQPAPSLDDVQRLTYDTRSDYPGAWLHDNRTVLFESNRVGVFRLYQQRLQDRTAEELDTGAGPAVLPQVTPDGKWILYRKPNSRQPAMLFRIPAEGGAPEQVPIGGALDEFRCPLQGGSACVLRETESQKAFVYYALDPITGKGRELARTSWVPHIISDWTVAPDASAAALAIHDPGNPRIRIVPLNAGPRRPEQEVAVKAFGMLSGISWSADGKGWYVAADTETGTLIFYVDRQGESHVLRDTPLSTWGVPSPDGNKLAFVDQAVDSNVWMLHLGEQR